jgi:predicted transcriptional regulator
MPSAARRSPLYGRAEEVRRLITEEGFTLPAIGERYGMSTPAVRAFCKRSGIGERAKIGRPVGALSSRLRVPDVRQALQEGKTMTEIGAAVGVTAAAVRAFCSRNHIADPRPPTTGPRFNLDTREAEIRKLLEAGNSFGRTADAIGCTRSAMIAWCSRRGIKSTVAQHNSGSRTTQRKLDRGFDGRALGNAGAGSRRTARQQDALEVRKLKDLGAIVANCKTGGTLPALTAEERVAKKEQIQSGMAGLLRAAEDYAATLGAGVKLRDVREGQCRYPLWPEGSDDHRVCGRPVAGERSYCASCAQRTLYYVAPDLRAPRDPNVIRRKW